MTRELTKAACSFTRTRTASPCPPPKVQLSAVSPWGSTWLRRASIAAAADEDEKEEAESSSSSSMTRWWPPRAANISAEHPRALRVAGSTLSEKQGDHVRVARTKSVVQGSAAVWVRGGSTGAP